MIRLILFYPNIYLSRYSKTNHFAKAIIEQFIETKKHQIMMRILINWILPIYFTCWNIYSTFWHSTHTTLRIRWWICIYVMNIRCIWCIFKISNGWITLNKKKNQIFVLFFFSKSSSWFLVSLIVSKWFKISLFFVSNLFFNVLLSLFDKSNFSSKIFFYFFIFFNF